MNIEKLEKFWADYKNDFFSQEYASKEHYKWQVLDQCFKNWDWNVENKATMFKKTFDVEGPKNLWASGQFYPIKMIEQFYEIDQGAVTDNFSILFDERKDLTERIAIFKKFAEVSLEKLKKAYPNDKIEQSYHGDLRAISIYLTLQYPEKYYIYKHGVFKDFCRAIELPAVKSGQVSNYIDYIKYCEEILNFIIKDQEFISQYKLFCTTPSNYNDPFFHLLVQDFIYSVASYLSKPKEASYWIFQCNPDMFDIVQALNNELVDTWTVTAHKDKIKQGDKVIIWKTGENSGCYALASVTSEPSEKDQRADDYLWKVADTSTLKAGIQISHNLADQPILKNVVDENPKLKDLKAGNQGTNFQATREQYETLLSMTGTDTSDDYFAIKKILDSEKLQSFYQILRNFIQNNSITKNDDRISFNVRKDNNSLAFIIGGRYCLRISKIKDKTEVAFISETKRNENSEPFKNKTGSEVAFWNKVESFAGYENEIYEGLLTELKRGYINPYRKYSNTYFERDVYQEELPMQNQIQINYYPLNTIFYGPPGTGKTHNTVKRAAEIISGSTVTDYAQAQKIFNDNLGNRIEFITFHQNYSYEDFIQGLRPDTENGNQLTFQKKDGVFLKVAVNALFEYFKKLRKNQPDSNSGVADLNEVYLDFVQGLKAKNNTEYNTATGLKIQISDFTKNDNIEFKHQNSSRGYVVSGRRLIKLYEKFPKIELVKNVHSDIRDAIGGCNTTVYFVALREFIKFIDQYAVAEAPEPLEEYEEIGYESKKKLLSTVDPSDLRKVNTQDVLPYVIIIDEINRANISRVFGELITLIEPDKRSHGEIPLQCTLPTGDEFIVPSNLYIIGTMNTADKSIALLDIALRRRFEFEAMYPLYYIEGKEIYDNDILKKINEAIIKKKGHDFQIGHAYFMNNSQSLADRMNKRVIPLLMEYFMNDEKEVTEILKSAGLSGDQTKYPLQITAS